MTKFIEVNSGGEDMLVNLEYIALISKTEDKTIFLFDDGTDLIVDEPYKNVKMMIGSAQGGIAIDSSRIR